MNEPPLAICQSKVLVQFFLLQPPIMWQDILFELQIKKQIPILIHRDIVFYHHHFEWSQGLKEEKCFPVEPAIAD